MGGLKESGDRILQIPVAPGNWISIDTPLAEQRDY